MEREENSDKAKVSLYICLTSKESPEKAEVRSPGAQKDKPAEGNHEI